MSSANTCKHFNGIQHKVCEAGVDYADVRDASSRPARWPCFDPSGILGKGCATTCQKHELATAKEVAAEEAAIKAAVEAHLSKLAAGVCPVCEKPIVTRKQVDRCVYAEPCGHRLGQGQA